MIVYPATLEAIAIREALVIATDCLEVVNALNKGSSPNYGSVFPWGDQATTLGF